MRRRFPALLLACLTAVPAFAQNPPAAAQTPAAPQDADVPYDARLARLAEILGALSYLRPLCGIADEGWRSDMQAILDADTASEPVRRARMTAAFNRGYRSFAAIHTACSRAALAAESRYRAEGATLVAEITSRFGN